MSHARHLLLYAGLFLHTLPTLANNQLADEIFSLPLEELLNVDVSISSRNDSNAFVNAAAVYVITQADIRASGMRSLPELLRMVPGLHVSRTAGSQWEISSRNKTRRFSGYLLVAIDGRAVHNPLFGGVFWDMQHTPLADIERIEIVRGPGATTWGTNAVNGVINIISKNSEATQGTLISAGAGTGETTQEWSLRHGFSLHGITGRSYLMRKRNDSGDIPSPTINDDSPLAPPFDGYNAGADAEDNATLTQAGFRLDSDHLAQRWTLQGDIYQGKTAEYYGSPNDRQAHYDDISGFNILSRFESIDTHWGKTQLQLYIDEFGRENRKTYVAMNRFSFDVKTADIDLQHYIQLGRQHFALGIAYRYMQISTDIQARVNQSGILVPPSGSHDQLASAFIQDSISLLENTLDLIIGIKAERNNYSGQEMQPSGRLLWRISDAQNLWMAYSRASKSPVLLDDEAYSDDPALAPFDNDPVACSAAGAGSRFGSLILPEAGCVISQSIQADSQQVWSKEIGYRWQGSDKSIDIALFYDDYETQEFIVDTFVDTLYGAELSLNYHINESWQTRLNYTRHEGSDYNFFAAEQEQHRTTTDISQNTAYFRLSYQPISNWLIYSNLYYVDDIDGPVDDYTRLDIQLQWMASTALTLSLNGTNLLDSSHIEENIQLFSIAPTAIRRGFFIHASYDFGF